MNDRAPDTSLLSTLLMVETIATREGAESICRRLLDLRQRVEQDRFQLAVVGQFKRGKTSVLNALLHREVLPVGALPFTSVLTIVKHGHHQEAEVVFQSGERLPISVCELPEYVTEAGNPRNVKSIEHVEVSHPSEYLSGGVTLINCPGFGSLSDRNTHAAYEFLPRIDAAIFVTSPDPPLTSAEMEFLRRLAGATKRIFLVMNKVDLLDAGSVAAVLEFTRSAVFSALGGSIPVYAMSARHALTDARRGEVAALEAAGFRNLESDLREFLKYERNEVFYTSIVRSLLNCIADLQVYIQLRVESTVANSDEFERKRARFESDLAAALQRQRQNEVSLESNICHLAGLVEGETKRFVESRHSLLDSRVRAYLKDSAHLSKSDLASSLDRFLSFQIQHIFDQWVPDFESSLGHAFRDASARFLQATNEVLDRLRKTAFELFGAELSPLQIIEELPTINGGSPITSAETLQSQRPSFLLPSPIFRWRLLYNATTAAPLELERTGRVVACDLQTRLNSVIKTFTGNVGDRLREIIESVRLAAVDALDKHEHSESYDSVQRARLSADIAKLDQITQTLDVRSGGKYPLEAGS
jgi:GTPase SAR1 family protein